MKPTTMLSWGSHALFGLILGTAAMGSCPALANSKSTVTPKQASDTTERRWIKHKVIPYERVGDIAERYGVKEHELVRWNKSLQKRLYIYAGQTIAVYARKFPPPREKSSYTVQRGDTWGKIAESFQVRTRDLRGWNKKVPRQFRAGTRLVVYTNPQARPQPRLDPPGSESVSTPESGSSRTSVVADSEPAFHARHGGLSIGKPNRGRLQNGVRLPQTDDYTVRDPAIAWGSSHAVEVVVNAIGQFRSTSGYKGDLLIGAMSRRQGGRFRPHSSHQSGRDIDIRLPKIGGSDKIDWAAAWQLVKAFAASGEIEYIFLDMSRQPRLYRAAKASGASASELSRLIQYPRKARTNNGLVRHSKGHTAHFHIRIKCALHNKRCETY